jgi:hypothetical protein
MLTAILATVRLSPECSVTFGECVSQERADRDDSAGCPIIVHCLHRIIAFTQFVSFCGQTLRLVENIDVGSRIIWAPAAMRG